MEQETTPKILRHRMAELGCTCYHHLETIMRFIIFYLKFGIGLKCRPRTLCQRLVKLLTKADSD